VDGFAEEAEEDLIVSVQEVESRIMKDPVIVPIVVVDSVLPDIAGSVFTPAVIGRKAGKDEQPRKKPRLVQTAAPIDSLDLKGVKYVSSSDLGDSHIERVSR
jgi:hypothetical protein